MTGLPSARRPRSTEKVLAAGDEAPRHRPRRHRRRQCRRAGRDGARHHRHEHALRQFDHHRRARHRDDVRGRPPDPRRRRLDPGRQVGEEPLHGGRDHRQDARHHRLRQHRLDRRRAGDRPQDEGDRLRSLSSPTSARCSSASTRSSSTNCFRRADFITLHTPLTDKTRNIIDAAAIAKMKKGVRIINCARGGLVVEEDLADGDQERQGRRRRRRRLRHRAGRCEPAVRPAQRRLHAASRRGDHRGAGECRRPGRRADVRLPARRRGDQRPQHAVDHGRGGGAADALRPARRESRLLRRPAHRNDDRAASPSNMPATSPR